MRIPHLIIVTFTLISASISWSQSPTKVVLEDMGNVGFRISDAQSLANWVSNALAKRVGHDNVAYEGLLKSKKDLARRLGAPPGAVRAHAFSYPPSSSKKKKVCGDKSSAYQ